MAIEPSNDRRVPLFGADAGLVIGHPQRVGNNLIRWEHLRAEAETDCTIAINDLHSTFESCG